MTRLLLAVASGLAGCASVVGTVTPVDRTPEGPDPLDVRVALVVDGEARAYDITESGQLTLLASQPTTATKSHIALSPDGTWWAFCDRPRPFGEATLWAGPLGEARELGLPPDCHHPSPDATGAVAWAEFGDGSTLRRHRQSGIPTAGDGIRASGATLWHPHSDPDGGYITAVASRGSDVGPILVVETDTGETWRTEGESRGGWRDIHRQVVVAASGPGLLRVDLPTRTEETWDVFPLAPDDCDARPELPCGLLPREVGLSEQLDIAVATAPALGSDADRGWPLLRVDGPDEVTVLAEDGSRYGWPVWGASGDWVYALRGTSAVVRVAADGSGEVEVLLEGTLDGWSGWSGVRP